MSRVAYVMIRDQPWYRRSAFTRGLKACGFDVQLRQPDKLDASTVLVIWNRYAGNHEIATRVERAGGAVLVAENGYIGAGGGSPKFQVHPGGPKPEDYYCVARRFHNDDTQTKAGDWDRFGDIGVALKPWRTGGEYLLVCPNRSFGVTGRAMPTDWAEGCVRRLRKASQIPVRVRPHPGNNAPSRPLSQDLQGAAAVYVWSSSCGVHALAEGIPVYCDAPYWILKGAAATPGNPVLPDRRPHFHALAWAQFTCSEIESGLPFGHLLECPQ